MKTILPSDIFKSHIATLGKTGSGKSSANRYLIEALLRDKVPVTIIDPKGDWWGLRLAADGKSPGFPVVIFGGKHADIPIDAYAGAHVAELVSTGNRPAIIDLGGWTMHDRTIFFIAFAQRMFQTTRGGRVLMIDEVQNFAPKGRVDSPEVGLMLHWANRLAAEGRGLGINLMVASQRPQKVHNDLLDSCETLIAMRLIHPSSREAVADWLEGAGDKEKAKEILNSLAQMKRGEAWVWSPEIEFGPKRVVFPMFETFDSFAPEANSGKMKLRGWATVDLEDVKVKLAATIEKAKADDPKLLRMKIAELEKQMRTHKPATEVKVQKEVREVVKEKRVNVPVLKDGQLSRLEAVSTKLLNLGGTIANLLTSIKNAPRAIATYRGDFKSGPPDAITLKLPAPVTPRPLPTKKFQHEATTFQGAANTDEVKTRAVPSPAMLKAMMTAMAQNPNGLTKPQILTLSNYSPSGKTSTAFAHFTDSHLIEEKSKGVWVLTEAGFDELGPFEELPKGEELRKMLIKKGSESEPKMLKALFDLYPQPASKPQIIEMAGYKPSGKTSSAFAKFSQLGWMVHTKNGFVAADYLFE